MRSRIPLLAPTRATHDRYRITRPDAGYGGRFGQDFWRRATCDEVDCGGYLNGWRTVVPVGSDQAVMIRRDLFKTYNFTEKRDEAGMVCFTFPAGQKCFSASKHRLPTERVPIFRRGRQQVEYKRWVDNSQENLRRLKEWLRP